jgi:hypothetical protein
MSPIQVRPSTLAEIARFVVEQAAPAPTAAGEGAGGQKPSTGGGAGGTSTR